MRVSKRKDEAQRIGESAIGSDAGDGR
jgi:hypothetical protein